MTTHKRSGTHLTIDLFRRQFAECDSWKWWLENNSRLYLSLQQLYDPDTRSPISERGAIQLLRRCDRPLVKSHAFAEEIPVGEATKGGRLGQYWLDWLRERGRHLYVYRDGRDVLCSLQLLEAMRDRRKWLPLSDFIRERVDEGVSRVKYWSMHVERGLARADTIAIRLEDLVSDTRSSIDHLAKHLDLSPIYREPLLPKSPSSIWRARCSRLFERRPESTAILGRPRGLKLQKWREAFTREDREFFHQEAGSMLIRLGYEDSDAWVDVGQDARAPRMP